MPGRIAVVVKGYPRLSETFIAQEIHGLESAGLDLTIVSLRHPTDRWRHPIHDEIRVPVVYLPEYLHQESGRVASAWRRVSGLPGYGLARAEWLADLRRDPSRNRIRRFGQAMVLAAEFAGSLSFIYAHFMHTPASVARYAARIMGLPWAFSAHAKDVWTTPEWEKREKLADAAWAVTCTAVNRAHLAALAPGPERVGLLYHGVDLRRLPATPVEVRGLDGSDAGHPVRIVSVGRLVEKKGFDDLLEALAGLPATIAWQLDVVGGGALAARLQAQSRRLGLDGRIRWLGSLPHDEVMRCYQAADLFVLASRIAADGDRDGLPNVLMEAQCLGLPCVATAVSAIPELVEDGVTGLLVPAREPAALGRAVERLVTDPALRRRFGEAGRRRVRAEFDFEQGLGALLSRFGADGSVASAAR